MLQVEAPDVGAPQQAKVRLDPFWPMPPQPQLLGLSPPFATRQPLHLHHDERPDHDGQRPAAAPSFVRPHLRMQLREGSYAHRPVAGVLACVLARGLGPGARIRALHLRTMPTRPSGGGGWTSETRVCKQAATRPQTEEDLAPAPLKPLLNLDGIVARIEDEQRNGQPPPWASGPETLSPARRPPRWRPAWAGRAPRPPERSSSRARS